MKPGTVLSSLAVFKGQDPPVTKAREDYPAWVGDLAKPMPSLAILRRIPNHDAQDSEIIRYLKLSRRKRIQGRNEQASV
jgi:Mitochondrial ribosomal protein L37